MKREELTRYLEDLLEPGRFRDYCPNGLQVEGRHEIRRLVAGVSATQALLDAAVEHAADTILVHHGWFWRGEDGRVTGVRKTRLRTLLQHDINLYALPPAARQPSRTGQQRAAREAHSTGSPTAASANRKSAGSATCRCHAGSSR